MEIYNYLRKFTKLNDRIEGLEYKIEELDSLCKKCTPNLKDIFVQENNNSQLDDQYVKLIETKNELINIKIEKHKTLVELEKHIDKIGNVDLELILIYKYIDGLKVSEICKKLNLDRSTVWRKEKKAIRLLNKILINEGILKNEKDFNNR